MLLPKILIFFIIINFIHFFHFNIFLFCGILSLIFGSIGLIQQYNLIRFLTYSGIINVGYLLLSLNNITNLLINIIIYNITFFNILLIFFNLTFSKIFDLKGLFKFNPFLSFILTIHFFSLAGIPPLAGFEGKMLLIEEYLN
jgi:NADH-quinone oxidoreductase subunit N